MVIVGHVKVKGSHKRYIIKSVVRAIKEEEYARDIVDRFPLYKHEFLDLIK